MGYKAERSLGTFDRALRHWLSMPAPTKPYCVVVNGHVYTGSQSKHLSKSGRGYCALIRMRVRLGMTVRAE